MCAACTTSCPVYWNDEAYFGPQAIVMAHRFIFDSRDDGRRGAARDPQRPRGRVALPHDLQLHRRLPRGIQVTKAIQEVKRALIFRRV
jgi:succinate dehydrogenase / fumarate reductase iron-sulfur subunit